MHEEEQTSQHNERYAMLVIQENNICWLSSKYVHSFVIYDNTKIMEVAIKNLFSVKGHHNIRKPCEIMH